jgi:cytochrome c553
MKKTIIASFLFSILSTNAIAMEGGSFAYGQGKSALCVTCHGQAGISANNLWPNLAGQKEDYLAKQLVAFRGGTRVDPLMSGMAKGLTDQDIKDLATYFSSLKGCP